MLISKNWIKDFVKLPEVSDKELATRFTLATAEVEEVTTAWAHLNNIKVAKIIEINKHPEADKLNLVTFDAGGIKNLEVVCGAPNVKVGLMIPYAPIGTVLPGGFKLEPKKIRGILSEGMLCSEKELGLGDGTAGLMDLTNYSARPGQSIIDVLSLDQDTIIDVDNKSLTHRPDLWGHHGLAREFAAAFEKDFNDPYDLAWLSDQEGKVDGGSSPITPVVDKDTSCTAYLGLSIDNVKVAPSPQWLVTRLESVGLRPINNMVDIGNYVMLELGLPMHIFDRKKIEGELQISTVKSPETFITLDEVERELVVGDTVIKDSKKTLVIAGIMGGANSGVDDSTSEIFIEVANWRAAETRKVSTRLGLRTDSSQRYEKTLDNNLCRRTMLRAMELVLKLCPEAKINGGISTFSREDVSPLTIKTSAHKISDVLGKDISTDEVTRIFTALGFQLEYPGDDGFDVTVPSYRVTKDIECEADLIEEVGRMIGYDSIEPTAPLMEVKPVRLSAQKKYHRLIQDFMVTRGKSFEVMTYPLVGEKLLKKAKWPVDNVKLKLLNALSVDNDRMRPSLVPSVLEAIAVNQKNFDIFSLFEIGRSYFKNEKTFSHEENHLAFVLYGKNKNRFLELVNTTEELLESLSVNFQLADASAVSAKFPNNLLPLHWEGSHPFEFVNIKIMGRFQGALTSVHPSLLKDFKIKGHVALAVINLSAFDQLEMKDKAKFKAINKFPKSTFDCSVMVDRTLPAASVLEPLKKLKIKQLIDSKIVGVFPLNPEKNSVTIRSFFEDENETMSSELLKSSETAIVGALEKAGFPLKS